MIASWVASAAAKQSRDAAFLQHQDAIRTTHQFGQFGTGQQDTLARRRQFLDQAINVFLGCDVDAARRIVQEQDIGIGKDRPRQQGFLLIAAAKARPPPASGEVALRRKRLAAGIEKVLLLPRRAEIPSGSTRFNTDRVAFSFTLICSIRPCSLRSSGTSPRPAAALRGPAGRNSLPQLQNAAIMNGSSPNRAAPNSLRPAPTSPAMPSTSP